MHARSGGLRVNLRLNLDQAVLQFIETHAHGREFGCDVATAVRRCGIRADTPRDPLSHRSRLIFHRYKKSTRSTTPTIAESIAAPASPVAAVDALQPPCTISTVSPTPASTESSASTE